MATLVLTLTAEHLSGLMVEDETRGMNDTVVLRKLHDMIQSMICTATTDDVRTME